MKRAQYRYWTSQELELAFTLDSQQVDHRIIAAQLGRRYGDVARKLRESLSPCQVECPSSKPSQDQNEERDRRFSAPRDLTAILMGDPPLLYSALGAKMRGVPA